MNVLRYDIEATKCILSIEMYIHTTITWKNYTYGKGYIPFKTRKSVAKYWQRNKLSIPFKIVPKFYFTYMNSDFLFSRDFLFVFAHVKSLQINRE
jgi:hypothetical protein